MIVHLGFIQYEEQGNLHLLFNVYPKGNINFVFTQHKLNMGRFGTNLIGYLFVYTCAQATLLCSIYVCN